MIRALIVAGVLGAAGYVGARAGDAVWLAVVLKPLPILALAAWQARARDEARAGWVALGLSLSALGDVLLEWPADLFVPGLVAFLCGHLAYVAAFTGRAPVLAPLRALPFLAFGAGMFLFLRPGLGELALPVAAYVAVICTMAWRAAATVGRIPPVASALAVGGALTFVASDSLIALDRFWTPIPGASWAIMATYWLGQAGIAASTLQDE